MQAEKYISDEVLIRRVLEGQQEDFTLLVERHASPLLHFVGRMIPVREEAEEIVQDTLLAAYQRLNDFDIRLSCYRVSEPLTTKMAAPTKGPPFSYVYLCLLCFFGFFLNSTEVLKVFYAEGFDVSTLTINIFLGHANIYVGTLLEEFRSLGSIAED